MLAHCVEFPVEKMCKVFGVSRSRYYRWCQHRHNYSQAHDDLDQQIQTIFDQSNRTYGSPRITQVLNERGIDVSESTVARRMHARKLRVKKAKRYCVTTDSKHDKAIAPNLLDRNFSTSAPGLKWVSDITYFRVDRKWYYLTAIIDLADRYVVGWTISERMSAELTTQAAFKRAVANRPPQKQMLFHSDRGVQYACDDFIELHKDYQCQQSISRKVNCWDNAVAESFFKTIKTECINRHQFHNFNQAYSTIFRYIEGWYNTRRIHSANGGMPPAKKYQELTQLKSAA
ncbi:MAG: IS3 family transposase [Bacteroidota bacterium]